MEANGILSEVKKRIRNSPRRHTGLRERTHAPINIYLWRKTGSETGTVRQPEQLVDNAHGIHTEKDMLMGEVEEEVVVR